MRALRPLPPTELWVRSMVRRLHRYFGARIPTTWSMLGLPGMRTFSASGQYMPSTVAEARAALDTTVVGARLPRDLRDAEPTLTTLVASKGATNLALLGFARATAAQLEAAGVPASPSHIALIATACGIEAMHGLKNSAEKWEGRLDTLSKSGLTLPSEKFAGAFLDNAALRALFPEVQPADFPLPLLAAQLQHDVPD